MGDYEQVVFVECGRGGTFFCPGSSLLGSCEPQTVVLTSLSTGAMAVPLWGRREMVGGNLGGGGGFMRVSLDKATRRLVG